MVCGKMDCDIVQCTLSQLDKLEREDIKILEVVLLPDFFVDHVVFFPNFQQGIQRIEKSFLQGGGNVPGLHQMIHQGGNAANTALALARLGVSSHLISRTNELGVHLLKIFLEPYGVDITHVQSTGSLASTIALEFGENHSNVFLQDAGSVADFRAEYLTKTDWKLIESAHLVGVMNWSLTVGGTELAKQVFEYGKKCGIKTYMDTGDPSPRLDDIPALKGEIIEKGLVDSFSMNENEIRKYSGRSSAENREDLIEAGCVLHESVKTRLDVHTAQFSYSLSDAIPVIVPTVPLTKVYRATGAGDVWNAGNILGDLLRFSNENRLAFANILAACYISKKDPIPPTIGELEQFMNQIKELD